MPPLDKDLIDTFPVVDQATLKTYTGKLYKTGRPKGRRIIVYEAGKPVFDTDDCFCLANAINAMGFWLAGAGLVAVPFVD